MAKKKYYVVWKGRKEGVFDSWTECEKQVKGYSGASFRSYPSKQEAKEAFFSQKLAQSSPKRTGSSTYIEESISVDAGSHGNPGFVEYRGVDTKTGKVLFSHPGVDMGTNNLGEFLAIVHALAYLKQRRSTIPIYSDSDTAIKWVQRKKVQSTLKRDEETEEIWSLVDRAENWLQRNDWENPILKWNTKEWGEIKADYGRK